MKNKERISVPVKEEESPQQYAIAGVVKWREYELQDVVEKFIDYRGKTPEKTLSGVPLVTAKIVKNGKIQPPNEFIAAEDYPIWMRRGYPKINDVVMTTEAPLGEVALLKDNNVALAQRIIVFRGKQKTCDNAFLKYYLQSPYGQAELQGRASGSTVEGIKASELRRIKVFLPPFPEQCAISSVLSSLDDKIDLLHRQSKTLEGLASALWRKMFIEEAAPDWKKGTLSDIAENVKEGVSAKNLHNHEHYIGLEHIERKNYALYDRGDATSIESNKSQFKKRDILFGKLRVYFHKVCFAPMDGICSTDILVIRSKSPMYFPLCLLWFFSEDVVDYADASSGGTRMPRTNWEMLAAYPITLPPEGIITLFNQQVHPLLEKTEYNMRIIRILVEMRDTLLPKLISGEIKV